MANELRLAVAADLANGTHRETFRPSPLQIDQAVVGAHAPVVSVGTSEEDLSIGDVATLGWLFLQNLDADNFVTYGPKDGTDMVAMGRLKPGEIAALRLEPGITLRWIADTATVKVKVLLLNN